MYRCPCYQEEFTEEEFNNLEENSNCHKYCKVRDCYEYSGDYETYWMREREDLVREMFATAKKYGFEVKEIKA